MKKIVVFVMGHDRPGIIAAVTKTLFDQGCNLEDVSQTILQTDFVGIFVASMKDTGSEDAVLAALRTRIEPLGLSVHLRLKTGEGTALQQPPAESFVITTIGPDRSGLMAGITEVLARYGVNITNLKAVFNPCDMESPGSCRGRNAVSRGRSRSLREPPAPAGGGSTGDRSHQDYVMIYEVDIPSALDQHAFRTALYARAGELGLDLSLQHRDIFEQLNRV